MNICRRPKLSLPSLPAGRGGRGARGGGGVCGPESRDVSLCVRLAFVVITSKASSKENFTTKLPLTKEKSCCRNLKKRGAFQLVCMSCESDCSLGAAATLIAGSAVLAILSALLLTDDPVLQRSLFPFLPLLLAGWAAAFVAVRSPASLWQQGTHTNQSHCYSTHSRSISRTFFPISPFGLRGLADSLPRKPASSHASGARNSHTSRTLPPVQRGGRKVFGHDPANDGGRCRL